ncbi:uncharacterized protein [Parasteatoda tepidariorum]|uniref:uncharacterized protein isoform X1 n=2 Tax=Parasteatoda tepidariorum TaxID=114398 RepID=UPI001C724DF9|nr:uncharacterized protein LOC107438367 isoform X1 [Parasteatoda tepidariorum]
MVKFLFRSEILRKTKMPRSKKYSGGARPKAKNNTLPFLSNDFDDNRDTESAESKFCSDINGSIQTYESAMNDFRRVYLEWSRERQNTLSKLEELVADVHKDQLAFNKTGLMFKEANMASREFKNTNNPNVDFFASLAVFLTDAVDGVNSIVQACNVDKYMATFAEIMENDAEITKPLHKIRSKCFAQYHNVEEIIRRYHSETFDSTVGKISRSLKTEDMWLVVKSNSNSMTQVIEAVDGFFQQVSKVEVFKEISNSVGSYIDSNPAVLDACESAGKALYGIYDTWGRSRDPKDKNAMASRIDSGVNRAIMFREQREIMRLQGLTLDEDSSQAKLETKIREAIDDLEKETRDMRTLYDSSRNALNASFRNGSSYRGYSQYNF